MFTATKDLMLPATVTGSWPRPRWYDGGLWGRPLDTALLDVRFREQFLDAHATVIADQERAGLDILTNGDYHLDEDFAGRSWHHYPLQRWKGLEHEELQYERSRDWLLAFPPGTLMNEIETTWRWPRVVGKVEHNPKNPLEYAKLWRIAQAARAGKPVKFGTCSSQVLSIFLDSHTSEYDLDDKKQLIWDMATAMNLELRQLAAAGAKVIQIEEPTIHFTAAFHPEQTELLDFMVEAFNHEVEGLDDVELWIHTCWGNPNMQKVYSGESYANSIDIYLEPPEGRRLDGRDDRERLRRDRPVQAVRRQPREEGGGRRRQPPHSCRRTCRRSSRAACGAHWRSSRPTSSSCPPTAASAGRASTGPSRTTRRRPSPRAATSCSRSSGSRSAMSRPPTRRSRPTSCPTASR